MSKRGGKSSWWEGLEGQDRVRQGSKVALLGGSQSASWSSHVSKRYLEVKTHPPFKLSSKTVNS